MFEIGCIISVNEKELILYMCYVASPVSSCVYHTTSPLGMIRHCVHNIMESSNANSMQIPSSYVMCHQCYH